MNTKPRRIWRRPAVALAVVAVGGLVLGGMILGPSLVNIGSAASATSGSNGPSSSGTASPTSAVTSIAAPTTSATPTTATPAPTPAPLPALLGAIGDSYSQAWSVSPAYRGDHPQFSWVVGTSGNDGVTSILERLRALGAAPAVVNAATSGRKMSDALRQANLVVAAARKLGPGQTAYVTFELGTNDLCASPDPLTATATFRGQLASAIAALRAGLPTGSRVLMLPVPDFPHFREMTQADARAKAALALTPLQGGCYPYLGERGTNSLADANAHRVDYDAALEAACADITANGGKTGAGTTTTLYCTYNESLLADSDFTIADLSTYDYFHPSLSGQARMAADAWAADVWAGPR
jgi:lysophospholipase L1-like esterase